MMNSLTTVVALRLADAWQFSQPWVETQGFLMPSLRDCCRNRSRHT
ncbi:hypothetical protein RISK_002846 [Rhodopirellula islandica]|uniref:Uncharacterized protein n=1 Tax=Rhodopirellula islandica TaxID=595434 RepID=A0A0J1EHQ8_RHOIS|nr:hypothetical protein RISK_002846 [Rhodopirellula islandica]